MWNEGDLKPYGCMYVAMSNKRHTLKTCDHILETRFYFSQWHMQAS